jgi:hypothetical protein
MQQTNPPTSLDGMEGITHVPRQTMIAISPTMYGDGCVIGGDVTNVTACQDGYLHGCDHWCNANAKARAAWTTAVT